MLCFFSSALKRPINQQRYILRSTLAGIVSCALHCSLSVEGAWIMVLFAPRSHKAKKIPPLTSFLLLSRYLLPYSTLFALFLSPALKSTELCAINIQVSLVTTLTRENSTFDKDTHKHMHTHTHTHSHTRSILLRYLILVRWAKR